MSVSQPFAVTEIVARALGREIAPERRAAERRRDGEPCAGAPALRDAVIAAGRRHELAFVGRELAGTDLRDIVAAGTFPLVVLREAGDATDAIVLLGRERAALRGERVRPDGGTEPLLLAPADVAALLPADARVEVLVPLLAEPTADDVAREDDARDGGGRRDERTPVARYLRLLGREKRHIGLIYLYAGLAGVFALTLPLGVQMIVGLVSGGLVLQPVILLIAFVIVGTLVTGALQVMQLGVVELIQQRVFARLAFEFAFRLPRVHLERARGEDLPEAMNRFFEIKTIQKSLVKLLTDGVTAMLQVVLGLVLLSFYHPYFTLFGVLLIGAVAAVLRFTAPRGLETSFLESKYKYRVLHWLEEMARTVGAFKHAARSNLPIERMDAEVAGYLKYRRKHFRVLLVQAWAAIAVKTVITAGLLVLGTVLVIDRQINLGQFVASELVIVTVLVGVEKLILSLADVYDILVSVEKAGHVTDLAVEPGGGLAVPDVAARGGIEITATNVGYRYYADGEGALHGVSLVVRPRERIAITGAEGSGETTLLNVLTGLFVDYEGGLAYNGLPSRDVDRQSLRALVGRAAGEVQLFEGSLEENVTVGRDDVSPLDAARALERVGLGPWLHRLPDGLATRLGGGRRLPATVSRRIVLARCLAGRPSVLAFDEFFDGLEPAIKREVIEVVCAPDAPWSVIAVTHDPAFLAACDRIVLLRDGRVEREGSYEQLRGDPYFRTVVPPQDALVAGD
jgi:ABC-type bacteriocin/lantibiotic exporter with double-glycine peptidase domain